MQDATANKNTLIRVNDKVREKLDHIAEAKRWPLITTVDALCDHFMATDPQMRGDVPAVGQRLDVTA